MATGQATRGGVTISESLMHKELIALTMEHLKEKGYVVRDPKTYRDFLLLKVPCIPDIVATRIERWIGSDGKRKVHRDNLVVEIETKPTKASIRKKREQYEKYLVGFTLIIMDCRQIRGIRKGWDSVTMRNIKQWLRDAI